MKNLDPLLKHYLDSRINFRQVRAGYWVSVDFEADLQLLLGDFPDEPLWSLWLDGQKLGDLEDSPGNWKIEGINDKVRFRLWRLGCATVAVGMLYLLWLATQHLWMAFFGPRG